MNNLTSEKKNVSVTAKLGKRWRPIFRKPQKKARTEKERFTDIPGFRNSLLLFETRFLPRKKRTDELKDETIKISGPDSAP